MQNRFLEELSSLFTKPPIINKETRIPTSQYLITFTHHGVSTKVLHGRKYKLIHRNCPTLSQTVRLSSHYTKKISWGLYYYMYSMRMLPVYIHTQSFIHEGKSTWYCQCGRKYKLILRNFQGPFYKEHPYFVHGCSCDSVIVVFRRFTTCFLPRGSKATDVDGVYTSTSIYIGASLVILLFKTLF